MITMDYKQWETAGDLGKRPRGKIVKVTGYSDGPAYCYSENGEGALYYDTLEDALENHTDN
jgi:hypothetical protein